MLQYNVQQLSAKSVQMSKMAKLRIPKLEFPQKIDDNNNNWLLGICESLPRTFPHYLSIYVCN